VPTGLWSSQLRAEPEAAGGEGGGGGSNSDKII